MRREQGLASGCELMVHVRTMEDVTDSDNTSDSGQLPSDSAMTTPENT